MTDKARKTILLIDDSLESLRHIGGILQRDYRVQIATSGDKGLQIARSQPQPDLILLDVVMQQPDGHEVCRLLKAGETTRDIPVLFLTSRTDQEDERLGLELGASDYLSKPVNPYIILARIRTHLNLRETTEILRNKNSQLATAVDRRIHELQGKEARIRLLLDSTATAMYGMDLDGRCTFCNPACVSMLGYSGPNDLLGRNMHELVHYGRPDGSPYPAEECRIYHAFRKGENSHVTDEVLWRFDATPIPVEYWSYPERLDGKVVGAVVSFVERNASGLPCSGELGRELTALLGSVESALADLALQRTGEVEARLLGMQSALEALKAGVAADKGNALRGDQ